MAVRSQFVLTGITTTLANAKPAAGKALRLAAIARQLPKIPMLMLLVVLIIPAIFAPLIAPYDPLVAPSGIRGRLQPPVFAGGTSDHILGTDKAGRDVLSRVIHGSRVSIIISIIGIGIAGTIGITLGLIAGYYGGLIDALIMRLVDVSLSIPPVLLALSLAAALDPSFRTVIIVVGALLWSIYCRQVRGDTLAIRERTDENGSISHWHSTESHTAHEPQ